MKLNDWIDQRVKSSGISRAKVIEELAKASRVSLTTLISVDAGMTMGNYHKAKQISEATDLDVSIGDLCE